MEALALEILREYGFVMLLVSALALLLCLSGWVVAYYLNKMLAAVSKNHKEEREAFQKEREEMRKELISMHATTVETVRDVNTVITECVTMLRTMK